MNFFTLFIAFNLLSLTFIQATENSQTQTPKVLKTPTAQILNLFKNLKKQKLKKHIEASLWELYDKNGQSSGIGFFIAPNLFITNFYLSKDLLKGIQSTDEVHLWKKGISNTLDIEKIISLSALYDLILIQTKESSQHHLTLGENLTNEHENLFVIDESPPITLKEINPIKINNKNNHPVYFNHSNFSIGNGSPILNNKDEVVGIVSKTTKSIVSGINTNHLRDFIDGHIGLKCESIKLKDCFKKEIENLKKLAEQGNLVAKNELAVMYYEDKDTKKAFELFKETAEQGLLEAKLHLAWMYYIGDGIPSNYEEAIRLFKETAKEGDSESKLIVYYHEYEDKATQNYEEASQLLKEAVELGSKKAKLKLGKMYYYGYGVSQSYEKAFELFKEAAEKGNIEAQLELAWMYKKGRGVKKSERQANKWYKKIDDQFGSTPKGIHLFEKIFERTKIRCRSIFNNS